MNPRPPVPFIQLERLEAVLQLDPLLFVLLFALTSWFVYRLILKDVNPERHRNLRALFRNLLGHTIITLIFYTAFEALRNMNHIPPSLMRMLPYIGFLTLVWGAIVFIKACRIFAFEYLFLLNMQVGVPLLLVNLFTLLLVLIVGGWILSTVFQFQLASLVAGSAILSVVLGLALQETLGNLFAGIALQFDKPYVIGDWIELLHDGQRVVGQVHEISWRGTVLISSTDEVIIIPNRLMAQSQVSNFSGRHGPVLRSQLFRIPYGQPIEKVRNLLVESIEGMDGIRKHPGPSVLITEINENWMLLKLFYHLEDFGNQFQVGDQVISRAITALNNGNIPIASQRMNIELNQSDTSKAA